MRLLQPAELAASGIAAGTVVIDVREPHEWATGHIAGATLVPLGVLREDPAAHLPPETATPIVFVCAKGGRSGTAAQLAESHGWTDVASLDGGMAAWRDAGLSVVTPTAPQPRAADAGSPPAAGESETDDAPANAVIEPALGALVGTNVAIQRQAHGLTLDELARESGVSRSLLGQIELGRAVPSIGIVWKIAQALGVPFSTLLSTEPRVGTTQTSRAHARRLMDADGRFSSRALFTFGDAAAPEFYELWLAPHSREDAEAHRPGTREYLVVASGRLDLTIGRDKRTLETGDSIIFAADVPHSYANPAGTDCWMYLVMTYGKQG
jgi:rhodanese-related sulfurtransferase/transcriptional regulator with XRE-family HTH domain